ncbi:MAG: hypothetical protein RBT72_05475 [Spirochaetia bacterium]|jgi:hypothetical protein|nr:hypothetical protein [Spirochaetia bacterium]
MSPAPLFVLAHGASWILPDGRVIKIPGFHSSWISSHPSIAPGATNTAEFVAKTGWISAVLHEAGYLELIVRSREDERMKNCLWNLLSANAPLLQKVVIMVLGSSGCIMMGGGDFFSKESFFLALAAAPLEPDKP